MSQAKTQDSELKQALMRLKCCFWHALISYAHLMVARRQKLPAAYQASHQWFTVTWLRARSSTHICSPPFFFATEMTGAPQAEWLGQTKPLSTGSASCRFTSAFALRDNLYIGLDTGDESPVLIIMPTPRLGGSPGG